MCAHTIALVAHRKPRLVIALVIDQCSYKKLMELKPYFTGGLHNILERGIVYHNAYQPHGMPATATGHTAIASGTFAHTHGITGNGWYNSDGKKIICDDDNTEDAAVFATNSMHSHGKSSHNLMVDTVTDQFILSSKPYAKHTSYSISLKSRAAIFTAGKLGKPLWFDPETGWFTSSKAYFDKLPAWLIRFNKKKQISDMTSVTWNRAFTARNYPYRMFAKKGQSIGLFGKTIEIDHSTPSPYDNFLQTPTANSLIFELARICVDEHISKNANDQMLLWLCPSSIDRAGHEFGPDSVHVTDLLYHIDLELFRFYNYVTKHIRKKDVLIMITADHGMGSSPEEMNVKGYTNAQRIMIEPIKKELNAIAYKESGYNDMIIGIKAPSVFFDVKKLNKLPQEKRENMLNACKKFISNQPGIKRVWTYDELHNSSFEDSALSLYFKNQAHHGRYGQLIVQPDPYCFLTRHSKGVSHKSPYNYDTHVPLMIYQAASYERASIYDRVTCLQCAPTLAYFLGIPKPSATTQSLLPGVTPTNDPCF